MFNFKSIMETSSKSQNPNFCKPNCDPQLSYSTNQFNDSPNFHDIVNYLMSDLGDASEENHLFNILSENITNTSHGSSNSVPFARNMKSCGRELKNYKTQEESIRFAFRTKSDVEFMDDGYKWRKYGKKMVKSTPYPRNYFKCSSGGCNVKKRVERDSEEPSYVITTYQGIHNHQSLTSILSTSPKPSSLLFISSIN